MRKFYFLVMLLCIVQQSIIAQQPVINYILTVDSSDLSGLAVEMRIRSIPGTFRVAMFAHPEYDDRYWRYIENIRAESPGAHAGIVKEDSSLWKVTTSGKEVLIHYRLHLPAEEGQRAAWRPFLSATGGLISGPHCLMFVVGATSASSHIVLKLPKGWQILTGLEGTPDPYIFFASSAGALMDEPLLVGQLHQWNFTVDGVPHRIAYWASPNSTLFDSTLLVSRIQKIVQQAALLFGRLPYHNYSFLLQDGAYGSLEHGNSVSLGIPAGQLKDNWADYLQEIAHEYFHSWNLVRIRPIEYGDVDYKIRQLSRGLWWSEGLTMFYADLMLRRAHLPLEDSTRKRHLERLMQRYYNTPGHYKISPEKVSMAEYGPLGMLGDYLAGTHLQGEVLGTMLDLIIRDATDNKKNIDDVMRAMMEHFDGRRGFTGKDIEQLVGETCGCSVHTFFEEYVRGNKPVDFNKFLRLAGLRADTSWKVVAGDSGKPAADYRIYTWQEPNSDIVRLQVTDPSGCWGKAGLHTGDTLVSVNNKFIKSAGEFHEIRRQLQPGKKLTMVVRRKTGIFRTSVLVTGYKQSEVHISELKANSRQQALRVNWLE